MVIVPYKYEGLWVFDDAAVGLSKEPFNAGIDSLIDKATANIPDAQRGFRAIFNARQFPGAGFKLEWRRAESDGNWYHSPEFNQKGWLCPALLRYFRSAPRGNLRRGRITNVGLLFWRQNRRILASTDGATDPP